MDPRWTTWQPGQSLPHQWWNPQGDPSTLPHVPTAFSAQAAASFSILSNSVTSLVFISVKVWLILSSWNSFLVIPRADSYSLSSSPFVSAQLPLISCAIACSLSLLATCFRSFVLQFIRDLSSSCPALWCLDSLWVYPQCYLDAGLTYHHPVRSQTSFAEQVNMLGSWKSVTESYW